MFMDMKLVLSLPDLEDVLGKYCVQNLLKKKNTDKRSCDGWIMGLFTSQPGDKQTVISLGVNDETESYPWVCYLPIGKYLVK